MSAGNSPDRVETAPGVSAIIKGDSAPIQPDKRVSWRKRGGVMGAVASVLGAIGFGAATLIQPNPGNVDIPPAPTDSPAYDNSHGEGLPLPQPVDIPDDSPRRGPDVDIDGDGTPEKTIWPMVPSTDALAKASTDPSVGPLPAPPNGSEAPVLPMTKPGDETVKA